MKNIFKLILSLIGNQILATVGAIMCIIFVNLVAGDTITAHILFLAITMTFFVYIEYRAGFTSGFHDSDRREKPKSKKFIFKGALAGFVSAIPLCVLVGVYLYFYFSNQIPFANLIKLITRIVSMYYSFPMCNLFPNHCPEVLISSLFFPVVIPMIGYIMGYKGIYITDFLWKKFNIKPKV